MGRHHAHQFAATNVPAALQAARGCPDAWYRVQALASVAEHADPKLALSILEEAAREALACHDAYGTVAVISWPLSVAMARGFRDFVERELPRCLALAGQVTPAASQAYALETLWTACFAVDAHWAKPVWTRILALCHPTGAGVPPDCTSMSPSASRAKALTGPPGWSGQCPRARRVRGWSDGSALHKGQSIPPAHSPSTLFTAVL
ncbi:hypothetical protein [Bradyrhizobium yuanmingense]|uniref:hypothetical protein n=1 Tax=Bradyrhizobium yuanmingense TaxID=108015 RepID=UPI0023B8EAC6|nr:hypothetical protein [Bradyrhizobium yuanmingense]MDF0497811.1 hypothetical protein [Bradyrhizobium yuanmingense]